MTDPDAVVNRTIRNPWFVALLALLLACIFVLGAVLRLKTVTTDLSTVTSSLSAEQQARIQLGKQNNTILKSVQKTQDQISDCLTPTGDCAKRSAAGTQNIGTAITYCTLNLPADAQRDKVVKCIFDQLQVPAEQ